MDLSRFFHPSGERGPTWRRRETEATQICNQCPVRQACLEHAITIEEPYGVWGGIGERERWQIVQQRRRDALHSFTAIVDAQGLDVVTAPDGIRGRHRDAEYSAAAGQ